MIMNITPPTIQPQTAIAYNKYSCRNLLGRQIFPEYGDVNSTLAMALVCAKLGVPVAAAVGHGEEA